MGAAFGAAILGIYVLVVAQFGSFRLPLVILTPIPLTLIGILIGHWLLGAPFTATSMIGFIALAGIIVRNSILLVDFIRHSAGENRSMRDIVLEAGAVRFKPILLTALAAMIGAATILLDPIFQGLAISLLFGLASSTLLTVLVIPAIYIALRDRRPQTPAGEIRTSASASVCFGCVAVRDLCQRSRAAMPAAIAATNTDTSGDSVARLSSAGPGHNPTSPQPIPNSADPTTSGRSISSLVGQKFRTASSGCERPFASMNPGTDTARAATITTARLGSQVPKISRKPKTFVGCTIPEISRPAPKIKPHSKDAITGMVQPPKT